MSSKEELEAYLVVQRENGSLAVFRMYTSGTTTLVYDKPESRPIIVSPGRSLERELRIVGHVGLVDRVPHQLGYPDLDEYRTDAAI